MARTGARARVRTVVQSGAWIGVRTGAWIRERPGAWTRVRPGTVGAKDREVISENSTIWEEEPSFYCSDGTKLAVKLRFSKRAKRRRINLSPREGLEVVYPATGEHPKPAQFLEEQRQWIERAVKRTELQRQALEASRRQGLPRWIDFEILAERWRIDYQPSASLNIRIGRPVLLKQDLAKSTYSLPLSGNVEDQRLCRLALQRFVLARARAQLPRSAHAVLSEIGQKPSEIRVKRRKHTWGTCSSIGVITLDARALLLPRELAREIILHEAAHLKVPNHSAEFYRELYSYPGASEENEKTLKRAAALIPAWFEDTE